EVWTLYEITGDAEGRYAAGLYQVAKISDKRLVVWNLAENREVYVAEPPSDSPNTVRILHGVLYVGYRSGALRAYRNTAAGWTLDRQTSLGSSIVTMRESGDGSQLVVVTEASHNDPPRINVLDTDTLTNRKQRDLAGAPGRVNVTVLNDGRIVVAYG